MHIRGAKYRQYQRQIEHGHLCINLYERKVKWMRTTLKLPYFEGKRNCFIFFLKIRTRKFETIRYIKKKQLRDKKNIIKS